MTDHAFRDAEQALRSKIATGARHADYLPELKAANEAWRVEALPLRALRTEAKRLARAEAQSILNRISHELTDSERAALQRFTTLSL